MVSFLFDKRVVPSCVPLVISAHFSGTPVLLVPCLYHIFPLVQNKVFLSHVSLVPGHVAGVVFLFFKLYNSFIYLTRSICYTHLSQFT